MTTFSMLIASLLFSKIAYSKECIHPPREYRLFEGCYERRTIKKLGTRSIVILNLTDEERTLGTDDDKENSVAIVLNQGKKDTLLTSYCSKRCFDPGNPKPRVELSTISRNLYLLSTYDVSQSDRHGVKLRLFALDMNSKKAEPIAGDFEVRREEKVKIKREKDCYHASFKTLSFKDEPSPHTSGYSVHEKAENVPIQCKTKK
jgi:hypothetical protein